MIMIIQQFYNCHNFNFNQLTIDLRNKKQKYPKDD
jgi:hypothetical protein